jgi:hypothetical protein
MTVAAAQTRVCPTCGATARDNAYCTGCGRNLASLAELPSRSDWERRTSASGARAGSYATSTAPLGATSSVRALLHPSEQSRFVLAMLAAGALIAFVALLLVAAHAGAVALGTGAVVLILTLAALWIAQQLFRARLLGRSVKVGPESQPELQALVDEIVETLQYRRRIDVYITAKENEPVTMTSFLGTRAIMIEGGVVSELLERDKRAQLVYLIGRHVGALRAKHTRLDLLVVLLAVANALRFVSPLLLPWYRATTYSGDQIGMMCCGDLDAALQATRRLLVGKELARDMPAGSVMAQVGVVRHHALARWTQLFAAEPHAINRYANLLCFGRYHDPATAERLRASMAPEEARMLDALWDRSPHRRRLARLGV